MTPRLRKCDEGTIAGRLAKAEQFMEGAERAERAAERLMRAARERRISR